MPSLPSAQHRERSERRALPTPQTRATVSRRVSETKRRSRMPSTKRRSTFPLACPEWVASRTSQRPPARFTIRRRSTDDLVPYGAQPLTAAGRAPAGCRSHAAHRQARIRGRDRGAAGALATRAALGGKKASRARAGVGFEASRALAHRRPPRRLASRGARWPRTAPGPAASSSSGRSAPPPGPLDLGGGPSGLERCGRRARALQESARPGSASQGGIR